MFLHLSFKKMEESKVKFIIVYTTLALAVLIIGAGLVYSWMLRIPPAESPISDYAVLPTPTPRLPQITCYYFHPEKSLLVKEMKEIVLPSILEDRVKVTVTSLFEGSTRIDLVSLWPKKTTVRAVFYLEKEKKIIIDLSDNFSPAEFKHTLLEGAALYSLVNTIHDVSPDEIESVVILAGGNTIESEENHWVWKGEIYPDETWVSYK